MTFMTLYVLRTTIPCVSFFNSELSLILVADSKSKKAALAKCNQTTVDASAEYMLSN